MHKWPNLIGQSRWSRPLKYVNHVHVADCHGDVKQYHSVVFLICYVNQHWRNSRLRSSGSVLKKTMFVAMETPCLALPVVETEQSNPFVRFFTVSLVSCWSNSEQGQIIFRCVLLKPNLGSSIHPCVISCLLPVPGGTVHVCRNSL